MGWLSGWSHRKSHVINAAAGAGTNYQVKVKVNRNFALEVKRSFDAEALFGVGSTFGCIRAVDLFGNGTFYFLMAPLEAGKFRLLDSAGNVVSGWAKDLAGAASAWDCLDFEDLDSDGQNEVVYGSTGSGGKLYVFERDGTEKDSVSLQTCALGVGNTYGSEQRIIVAEEGTRNLKCYKIVSGALSLVWTYTDWRGGTGNFDRFEGTHRLHLADIDNDGVKEILVSNPSTGGAYGTFLAIKDNGSSASAIFWKDIDGVPGHVESCDVRNVYGTATPAILFVGDKVYVYHYSSGSWVQKWATQLSDQQQALFCRPDGSTWKVAVFNEDGNEVNLLNIDTGAVEQTVAAVDDNGHLDALDINGDGKDEIIAADNGVLKVYASTLSVVTSLASVTFGSLKDNRFTSEEFDYSKVVDLDGDGLSDAVTGIGNRYAKIVGVATDDPDGDVVCLNGKCRSDFGDVRFTSSDGTTEVAYCLETVSGDDEATFWVKIPSDLSSVNQVIYVYYGKADAATTSNGASVFPSLFESFEDGTVGQPPAGWTGDTGYFTVQNDQAGEGTKSLKALASAGNWKYLKKNIAGLPSLFAIRYKLRADTVSQTFAVQLFSGSTTGPSLYLDNLGIRYNDGSYHTVASYTADEWIQIEQHVNTDTDRQDILVDDVSVASNVGFENAIGTVDNIQIWSYNNVARWADAILIRKFVSPEPDHGAWGSEEEAGVVVKTVADSLALADTAFRGRALTVADTMGISDSLLRNKSLALNDSMSLVEFQRALKTLRVSDVTTLTETLLTPLRILQINETVRLAEVVESGAEGAKKTRLFLFLGDLAIQLTRD